MIHVIWWTFLGDAPDGDHAGRAAGSGPVVQFMFSVADAPGVQFFFAPCSIQRRIVSMSDLLTGSVLPCGMLIEGSARPSISTSRLLPALSPGTIMAPPLVPFIRSAYVAMLNPLAS